MSSQVPLRGNRTLINNLYNNTQNIFQTSSFQRLYEHICVAAYDNSDKVDQMKCYPGTRTLLLERLQTWLSVPGNARRLLTWLDGPMGSGKTAVARTMAERVSAINKLIGVFIFRRGQPGRNDATRFVTTLAYQMAQSISDVRPYIEEELHRDPAVLQKSLSEQLDALILEPLRQMRSHNPNIDVATLPNLVIVDGLDECGAEEDVGKEEKQTEVLDLLRRLALSQDVLPFSILIHSRPEKHIKNWFSLESHESMTNRFTLDASYEPEADIRLFITESFLKILRVHPDRHLLPPNWPHEVRGPWNTLEPGDAITILVQRSSGQFIYAATAMVYIASQKHRPDKRLVSVLSLDRAADSTTHDSPTAIIDALYVQVLNSTDDHEMVKKILAFYNLFDHLPYRVSFSSLLSIVSISIQDLEHCLRQLESLVIFDLMHPLRFHHSSFLEFLEDHSRSGSWFLDLGDFSSRFVLCASTLFRDETDVDVQIYCLHIMGCLGLFWDYMWLTDLREELQQFCNFPHSSYKASVERFLSKEPLSSFIRLTKWVRNAPPGDTFHHHLAALIKPHIQPYLEDPHSFAHFLCWAIDVPGSSLTTQSHNNASSHWPGDLRRIVHALVWRRSFKSEEFAILFSIPSMNFLHDTLLIVLKTIELGHRHSRRWKHQEPSGDCPLDQKILSEIFQDIYTPLNIWMYALDCEQVLPHDFHIHIRNLLNMDNTSKKNEFQFLYNPDLPPPSHNSGVVSPLDFALAEYHSHLQPFQSKSRHYPFLRNNDYNQILIPSVSELAVYLRSGCTHFDNPVSMTATLYPCGWIDFHSLNPEDNEGQDKHNEGREDGSEENEEDNE